MEMPDYAESLDSSYTMLEFENLRVLPTNSAGEEILLSSLQPASVILVALLVDKGYGGVEGWIVAACPGEPSEEQKYRAVG